MTVSLDRARRAKATLSRKLEGTEGLLGIGITKSGDDYAVKINYERPPVDPPPSTEDGVPVTFEVVGKIRKRARKTPP
jgi:hypothetical protein